MDTLVAPIVRAIYDQTLQLQGFAGEVSMVSIATPPFWAADGNSQLPKVRTRRAEQIDESHSNGVVCRICLVLLLLRLI